MIIEEKNSFSILFFKNQIANSFQRPCPLSSSSLPSQPAPTICPLILNATCVIGYPGAVGIMGIKGHAGKSTIGDPGDPGPQGSNGRMGPPGIAGPSGVPGDTGMAGRRGNQGETGPIGPIGSKGQDSTSPGDPGRLGPPGITGPRGSKGPIGDKGTRGADGQCKFTNGSRIIPVIKGPKGDTGKRGSPGPRGQNGSLGDPGKEGTCSIYCQTMNRGPPGLPGSIGVDGPPGQQGESIICVYCHKHTVYGKTPLIISPSRDKNTPVSPTKSPPNVPVIPSGGGFPPPIQVIPDPTQGQIFISSPASPTGGRQGGGCPEVTVEGLSFALSDLFGPNENNANSSIFDQIFNDNSSISRKFIILTISSDIFLLIYVICVIIFILKKSRRFKLLM